MKRLLIPLVLVPTLIFVLLISIIQAQPYPEVPLMEANCLTPCFLGIHPGSTTIQEAVALLEAQNLVAEWVIPFEGSPSRQQNMMRPLLIWRWSDRQPAYLTHPEATPGTENPRTWFTPRRISYLFMAAMLGVAYLLRSGAETRRPDGLLAQVLPPLELLDEVMYKAIALGFAAFTIATVLGALWAAEAWGGYWSWDPKETWALIVWLNYAAWLHLRLTKGWRGAPMAWWAIVGLLVTLFAFLGVNMFLSGLHSYGSL